MSTRRVEVWGQKYDITVYQESKTVWIAVGDYMEQSIRAQGRSESSAAKHWQEAARYRGNVGPAPPVAR